LELGNKAGNPAIENLTNQIGQGAAGQYSRMSLCRKQRRNSAESESDWIGEGRVGAKGRELTASLSVPGCVQVEDAHMERTVGMTKETG